MVWGFESLSLKEAHQVAVGNELLPFSISMLYALAITHGFGVLEHPKEPEDITRPSIWRLPIVIALMGLPAVERIELSQGLWGAVTPKPTCFLAVNLPGLARELRKHRVTKDLPKRSAIGHDATGTWRTAPLKEYPPALNRALASTFVNGLWRPQAPLPKPLIHFFSSAAVR